MTAPAVDAEALAGLGVPITLADGTTVRLRYSMASLVMLEKDFGNVARIISTVQGAAAALGASFAVAQGSATDEDRHTAETYDGPSVFSVVVRVMTPGLLDARGVDPRDGQEVWLGEDEAVVARALDPSRLQEYMNAFGQAFNQAFGGGADQPKREAGGARPPARSRSSATGSSRSGSQGSRPKRSGT